MDPTWWHWSPLFWIFPLLCVIFMAIMMLMMFRHGGSCMPFGRSRARSGEREHETPRQILDRRYASGELTKEQYEAMRRDLNA